MMNKYPHSEIKKIADEVVELLSPHCERIEIAGSVRRKSEDSKDIEIVAIPKPYDIGLFTSGIALVLNNWKIIRGRLPCKYTQRVFKDIKIDIFFADEMNFGYLFAIRTGPAEFSHLLAKKWIGAGYKGEGGYLYSRGNRIPVAEEYDLFGLIGMDYIHPQERDFFLKTNRQP